MQPQRIEVIADDAGQRVDVLVDGEPFTSYVYTDTLAVLKKPVLYPVRTAEGVPITRGYPLEQRPGERIDHPHQIGYWLNYGSVGGLDFWNNSSAIPAERAHEMGTIRHLAIESTESGDGAGHLIATSAWMNSKGDVLLNERTHFVFRATPGVRIIDRFTTLTAGDEDVSFADHKEGVLGLRMTRALEMPAAEPVDVVGPDGSVVSSSDNTGINGAYLNSEGVEGYPDVWAKRARWMTLSGVLAGADSVTVAILDHPENPGHPTYWHARDYGLFAANPLGQAVFSDGMERLDFALASGASTTFRYRLVIFSGNTSPAQVEAWYDEFVTTEL